MASIKLSYCQLIRIILAQLGGNPLQQVFTQLTQGMPSISVRSGLFSELAQIKAVVDEITNRIQQVTKDVNDYERMAKELANQFYKNPMATSINLLKTEVQSKITALEESGDTSSEQYTAYTNLLQNLNQLLDITNKLSGVTPASGGDSCGLADLLGNGCTPNKNVPDIDLKVLLGSLNKQNILNTLKTKIAAGTGYADLQNSIADLNTSITSIGASFSNIFNKQFIKNAVSAYVNQILFQLLSGCGNDVLALTLKDFTGVDITSALGNITALISSNTNSTTIVTNDTGNVVIGQNVFGTNVDTNTKILSINELTGALTLSKPLLGRVSGNLTFNYANTGSNLNIANALIEATIYLQNVYGSGNVQLANAFVTADGNVTFYSNIQDSIDTIVTGL